MKLEEMSSELAEQAKACTTKEERLAFLSAHQIELTPEQLEAVSGGSVWDDMLLWAAQFAATPRTHHTKVPKN